MNDHTIALVRESFDLIEPIASQAGQLFYANLFEIDPSLRPLFKGDLLAQGDKLMHTLALAVANLDRPEQLTPLLQSMGRQHAGYGVRDEHYDAVRAALLKTLWQGLGVAYNAEVEQAWTEVYAAVAVTMKEAAAVTA